MTHESVAADLFRDPALNRSRALLIDLIRALPDQWTAQDRRRWLNAVEAQVDWLIPVLPEPDGRRA